jgi:hypothetical protein
MTTTSGQGQVDQHGVAAEFDVNACVSASDKWAQAGSSGDNLDSDSVTKKPGPHGHLSYDQSGYLSTHLSGSIPPDYVEVRVEQSVGYGIPQDGQLGVHEEHAAHVQHDGTGHNEALGKRQRHVQADRTRGRELGHVVDAENNSTNSMVGEGGSAADVGKDRESVGRASRLQSATTARRAQRKDAVMWISCLVCVGVHASDLVLLAFPSGRTIPHGQTKVSPRCFFFSPSFSLSPSLFLLLLPLPPFTPLFLPIFSSSLSFSLIPLSVLCPTYWPLSSPSCNFLQRTQPERDRFEYFSPGDPGHMQSLHLAFSIAGTPCA